MADNSTRGSSRANASVRSRAIGRIPDALLALGSTKSEERRRALAEVVRNFDDGSLQRPQESGWSNLLARTFFSGSQDEFSPSRLVWEAVVRGLSVIGSADTGNLGALGEMLAAGDALRIRATVSMLAKTFCPDLAGTSVNCPGQPGFVLALGGGFVKVPDGKGGAGALFAQLLEAERRRGSELLDRINPYMAPLKLEYEADVLPLLPGGNPEVRHIAKAYAAKAEAHFPDRDDRVVFWADVLGRPPQDAECLLNEGVSFLEVLEDRIRKTAPEDLSPEGYPGTVEFLTAVREAGAVPCVMWNGGGEGVETEVEAWVDRLVEWGVRGVAVIPDRIWNVPDAEAKTANLAALDRLLTASRRRGIRVLAGSPMDGPRQKFVDSFDAPELAPYFRDFVDSAFWLYGHTVLTGVGGGMGVGSRWAARFFAGDRERENGFFIEAGRKAPPGRMAGGRLTGIGAASLPEEILSALGPPKI